MSYHSPQVTPPWATRQTVSAGKLFFPTPGGANGRGNRVAPAFNRETSFTAYMTPTKGGALNFAEGDDQNSYPTMQDKSALNSIYAASMYALPHNTQVGGVVSVTAGG